MRIFIHRSIPFSKFLLVLFLFLILIFYACTNSDQTQLVFVGTYTGTGSEGIYAYRFNPEKCELSKIGLVAKTDNPSFITIDPDGQFLYSVNETDSFQNEPTGSVSVFAINRESGRLTLLQRIPSLGAGPAHLSLDSSSRHLMVANYNSGNAAVFPIGKDGRLDPHTAFIQNTGSGVNPDRQSGPHAHFIQATSDNRFVMIADLGIDRVLVYGFDGISGSLTPIDSGFVKLDPGSGPRHIAFHPSGRYVYVLNELTSAVTVFSYESETGRMQKKQTVSTLPGNFHGENTAAEIAVDAKSQFLYLSNRGDDSIGLFSINSKDGSLMPVGWISSGGKTPRHFEIDPTGQWLLAANQNSNNIVLFRIDQVSGKLIQTSLSSDLISPVCIRFLSMK